MKRQPRNWLAIAVALLGSFAAFATGLFVATKFVSPCVCIYAQPARIQ